MRKALAGARHAASRAEDGQRMPDGIDALRMLWRRRATVAAVTVLLVLAAALFTLALPRAYRASAEVMVAPAQTAAEHDPEEASLPRDSEARLASEVEILTSRSLLRRLVRSHQLLLDPEFNPYMGRASGLLDRLDLIGRDPSPADLRMDRQRERTVAALASRLSVRILGRSRVVEIAVMSRDPDKAARLANSLARIYLDDRMATRRALVTDRAKRLDDEVAELRRRARRADVAVEQYRRRAGLLGRDAAATSAEQITELQVDLARAGARRAEAAAKLAQVEAALAREGGDSVPGPLRSPLVETLRQRLGAAIQRKAELSAEYGRRHPRIRKTEAELARLRAQLGESVRRRLDDMRAQVEVARTRERAFREAIAKRRRRMAARERAAARLHRLKREAEAARTTLQTYLARLEQTSLRRGLQQPAARVISSATAPGAPHSPNVPLILGLAFLAGLPCGAGAASLLERLDGGIRDRGELEAWTGLRTAAVVPRPPARYAGGRQLARYVLARPRAGFAEALRGLEAALRQRASRPRPRSVLITSAVPREGKTTIALALARQLACDGRRVLLLEADLRHPQMIRLLNWRRGPGLGELIAGRTDAAGAVRVDRFSGLHVLPAGAAVRHPALLLGTSRFKWLLSRFAAAYDLVIVDAPPVLPVTDARMLAGWTDATVLVTRWRRTKGPSVATAVKELEASSASLHAAVLTRVDRRRYELYAVGEGSGGDDLWAYYRE